MIHCAHVVLYDCMLPLGEFKSSNPFCEGYWKRLWKDSLCNVRRPRGRYGHDKGLRARVMSIESYADRSLYSHRPLSKISSSPLVLGASARYSLIQSIHLPIDAVIQLRCPLMFRRHSCLSARARFTSLNRITISRTYDTHEPGHQVDRTLPL